MFRFLAIVAVSFCSTALLVVASSTQGTGLIG